MDNLFRTTLDNGIRVVIEKINSIDSILYGFTLDVGSENDPENKEGLAHLMEHLIIRNNRDILLQFDNEGVTCEASTEREHTSFNFRFSNKHLVEKILSDSMKMILNNNFNINDLENEKSVINNEIEYYNNQYYDITQQDYIELLFKNTGLAHSILGTKQSLNNINISDIKTFFNTNYLCENIILSFVVGSDIDIDNLYLLVDKTFRHFKSSKKLKSKVTTISSPRTNFHTIREFSNLGSLIYYTIGIPGLSRIDSRRVDLYALSSILGEGLNSRLMSKLREIGYVYDIDSSYYLFKNSGAYFLSGVSNTSQFNTIYDMIINEFNKLSNMSVNINELKRAKRRLTSNLLYNIENPELRLVRLSKLESWHRRTFTLEQELSYVDKISCTSLNELSNYLFNQNVIISTISSNIIKLNNLNYERIFCKQR